MTMYLVQIETAGDDRGERHQALLPAERVNSADYDLDTPAEIAATTAANQNLTDTGRVIVTDLDGHQLAVHEFDYLDPS